MYMTIFVPRTFPVVLKPCKDIIVSLFLERSRDLKTNEERDTEAYVFLMMTLSQTNTINVGQLCVCH